MCNLKIFPFSFEDGDPLPRTLPQLRWAVPVDIVELGASLEAYLNTQKQVYTLLLAHRFSQNPISRLPQEVVEQIIQEAQLSERDELREPWLNEHTCFQDRCTPGSHYKPNGVHTKAAFESLLMYDDEIMEDYYESEEPDDFTAEKRAQIVVDRILDIPEMYWEGRTEMHYDVFGNWLNRTCLCEAARANGNEGGFIKLNNVLKSHFGLEVVIFHEAMSRRMQDFLPDTSIEGSDMEYTYNTIAYLVLPSDSERRNPGNIQGTAGAASYKLYAPYESLNCFRQVIDPSTLLLSEHQRLRFTKSLRVLCLKPSYHLTELENSISLPVQDGRLMKICGCCHCPRYRKVTNQKKTRLLHKYLAEKDEEIASESWPKLMNLSPSAAVTPNGLGV